MADSPLVYYLTLEAKEGVMMRPEDRTVAKVSYQTFFRLYPALCVLRRNLATASLCGW